MNSNSYGLLAAVGLGLMLTFAAFAAVYVRRLASRPTTAISEEVEAAKVVMAKVRKQQPMSHEELALARQIIADRTSPWALAIPGMIFSLGCFYVFGSLEHLHGARPSERTFLGVIPMMTSTSLAIRLLATNKFKRRVNRAQPITHW